MRIRASGILSVSRICVDSGMLFSALVKDLSSSFFHRSDFGKSQFLNYLKCYSGFCSVAFSYLFCALAPDVDNIFRTNYILFFFFQNTPKLLENTGESIWITIVALRLRQSPEFFVPQ